MKWPFNLDILLCLLQSFLLVHFFALLNNIVEIRSDAYKLCTQYQRSPAIQGQDMGSWEYVLTTLGMLSVITNAFIVAFSSNWVAQRIIENVGEQNLTAGRLFIIIIFEHAVFGLKLLVAYLIPDIPGSVQVAIDREAYVAKLALDGKIDFTLEDIVNLAKALHELHAAGFVHRDISPSNIGHYPSGRKISPFIRDFGFSLHDGGLENSPTNYSGSVITASDTVLLNLREGNSSFIFQRRDDLESLLKTFFILITNRRPFIEKNLTLTEKAEAVFQFWDYDANSLFRLHVDDVLKSPGYQDIKKVFWLSTIGPSFQPKQGTRLPSPETNVTANTVEEEHSVEETGEIPSLYGRSPFKKINYHNLRSRFIPTGNFAPAARKLDFKTEKKDEDCNDDDDDDNDDVLNLLGADEDNVDAKMTD